MTTRTSSGEPDTGKLIAAVRQAKRWFACGRRRVSEDKPLWLGMSLVYFALGVLLSLIPFMGDLLLILISPMLLAGVIWRRTLAEYSLATPVPSAGSDWQRRGDEWIRRPAQELLGIFAQEEKMFAAILLGIVTLGLIMLVKIFGYLLVGGSVLSALAASQTDIVPVSAVIGMLVVAVLAVLLAMGLCYSVPFTVVGGRQPLAAITDSFIACRDNAAALLVLVAPFFLIYVLIASAFVKSAWLGYLLLLSLGLLGLPVFVASVYCSYLMLFPPSPSQLRR